MLQDMKLNSMKCLVTGGAGFIGSALALKLSEQGHDVVVVDNFNEYYDASLKRNRVRHLIPHIPIYFLDITEQAALTALMKHYQFDVVCHLAGQAGVRYSVEAPEVYIHSNVRGTQSILEAMRTCGIKRMVFASTSSVYGIDSTMPFKETANADRPVSIYAATKRTSEMMAYTYYQQYQIQTTCLRFFTVYGPWSRPDMAMIKFADAILKDQPIELYNEGKLRRDFTYVDDIVAGLARAVERPLGYEIVNLGNGSPVDLLDYVATLESALGKNAERKLLPMQPGDVYETYADITKAQALLGYHPSTNFKDGVKQFADWYKVYTKK